MNKFIIKIVNTNKMDRERERERVNQNIQKHLFINLR